MRQYLPRRSYENLLQCVNRADIKKLLALLLLEL